jgi:S-DNA-T family DNA segregation ATPase FtsK/SpoIIIE
MICADCHFDYTTVDPSGAASRLTAVAAEMAAALLTNQATSLRARPDPGVWSPLDYACHTRDVLLVQRDRLYLALVEDTPSFPRMYRDERVELDGYREQAPARVAEQLHAAAELAGNAFFRVGPDAWSRPLIYNWPEPRQLDVRWLAAHTVHEAVHHLEDFRRGLVAHPGPAA